jgi:hypothetical protein
MIVELVQDVVEKLEVTDSPVTHPKFIHGEKGYQNLLADEVEEDVWVFLDEPITSNDRLTKGGYLEETYPLTMLFAKKSELDFTPEQHRVLINEMRSLANIFINKIQQREDVREVKDISKVDIINIFDVNLTGCVLRISVIPLNEYTAC